MELDYKTVLKWRHRVQEQAIVPTEQETLADEEVEGDEMFQNAGEKATDTMIQTTRLGSAAIPNEDGAPRLAIVLSSSGLSGARAVRSRSP